jgi:hypothetical protein
MYSPVIVPRYDWKNSRVGYARSGTEEELKKDRKLRMEATQKIRKHQVQAEKRHILDGAAYRRNQVWRGAQVL